MSNEAIYGLIKNKDYIIKPFIFKIIKTNNLNINESLLLIYLINMDNPELDLNIINELIGLSNEETLEAFTSLTDKNLIKTEIIKNDDKVIERICLDDIYKNGATIINDSVKEGNKESIFDLFEKEFNRKLTPIEYEFISEWANSGVNEGLIKEALKEATYNGVSSLRYVEKIVYEWTKKGYKTVDDLKASRKEKVEKSKIVEIPDYNWLDEN